MLHGMEEAVGSSPIRSTIFFDGKRLLLGGLIVSTGGASGGTGGAGGWNFYPKSESGNNFLFGNADSVCRSGAFKSPLFQASIDGRDPNAK